MATEPLLIARDRFRPSLEKANRRAVSLHRRTVLAWAVPAILVHAAFATSFMPSGAVPRDVSAEGAITISNEMFPAMRIYLHAGSVALPLGTVLGLATCTFLVPGGFAIAASEFQIEARERGAEVGLLTEGFTLRTGQVAAAALNRDSRPTVEVRP